MNGKVKGEGYMGAGEGGRLDGREGEGGRLY